MNEKKTQQEPNKPQSSAKREFEALENKYKECQEKLANATNLAREYKADMERMRLRTKEVEKQKTIEVATKAVVEILPVLDNFELALENVHDVQIAKGFKLIHAHLLKVIEDMGAKKIENGTEFNPEFHEAISVIPAPDEKSINKIAHVVRTGYTMFGTVIRPTQVIIYGGDI